MFVLELRHTEARLIKFEDMESKNSNISINVYKSNERTQQMSISQQLYDEIMCYRQHLIITNKYQQITRNTIKEDEEEGYFLF